MTKSKIIVQKMPLEAAADGQAKVFDINKIFNKKMFLMSYYGI